jgi:hypothetical protein
MIIQLSPGISSCSINVPINNRLPCKNRSDFILQITKLPGCERGRKLSICIGDDNYSVISRERASISARRASYSALLRSKNRPVSITFSSIPEGVSTYA